MRAFVVYPNGSRAYDIQFRVIFSAMRREAVPINITGFYPPTSTKLMATSFDVSRDDSQLDIQLQ